MKSSDEMPQLSCATQAAWREWLDKNHSTMPGVWLKFAKQASGIPSVNYAEALEVALCYGWIDGQSKSVDESFWRQKFTPRKSNSIWSQVNRRKALALVRRGLMQPAGRAAIQRAKANGRWKSAYQPQGKSTVPPDLAAALKKNPAAARFFATLSSQNRYAVLFRLQTARKAETRGPPGKIHRDAGARRNVALKFNYLPRTAGLGFRRRAK